MRTRFRVPIYISVGERYFKKILTLESQSVSERGLSLETGQDIPLESTVLVVGQGDLAPSALIRGRVAHREMDPNTRRYTLGLEFTEFVDVTPEGLMACIGACQRREIA